jgi:hypothetical protein
MLSIVDSCEYKLVDANTITASVFSCICFDSSGNYKPAAYDNAVAGCSSAYPDDSTDFGFWLPGFCTNTNYATETAAASSTMAGASATAVVGLTSSPTVNAIGKVIYKCLSEYESLLIRTEWAFFNSYLKSGRFAEYHDFEPDIDYSCSN